jgi:hypothetical protein
MFINSLLRIAIAVLCLVFVIGSAGVWAQEPDGSLQQLSNAMALKKGEKIWLVDSSGQTIKGEVDRLSPERLDLMKDGEICSFSDKDIRQISWKKPDSILNGFLIGFGVGFGVTLPFNLAYANNEGSDKEGVAVAASALWGLIGGAAGMLVDNSIHGKHTMRFHPQSSFSWRVRPFYGLPSRSRSLPNGFPLAAGDSSKGLQVTLQF